MSTGNNISAPAVAPVFAGTIYTCVLGLIFLHFTSHLLIIEGYSVASIQYFPSCSKTVDRTISF